MVQELMDLKQCILEQRYEDALGIIDELEGMSKQAIIRNIESFLVRLLIHLIKNQIEERLTNSWISSISDSLVQIQKLNFKDNKTSYYIKLDEWYSYIDEAIERSIRPASAEVLEGTLKPFQVAQQIDKSKLKQISYKLLELTYQNSATDLLDEIDFILAELPGGKEWFE
ncbi:DUF29 family protein [Gloeothece citriformis]|nr:DUF29 family protein [Gloeothece citriformis]